MDDFEALRRSGDELLRRLARLRLEDMAQPSNCDGWSVYDLVNHVIGGARRYTLLLQNADAEAVRATRTHDHVGGDPVRSYAARAEPLERAFREAGALARVVHHPAGDRSGHDLLRMRVMEQALHAVDIARSLNLDERLDAELVDYLLALCAPLLEELREKGYFGPARPAPPGASPQQRLLAFAGR